MRRSATKLTISLTIALLMLSVAAVHAGGGGSGGGEATPFDPVVFPNLFEADPQVVYSETHSVAPNAPYAAQVPVEPAHNYLVKFSATADASVMVGEVLMMQGGAPQPSAGLAEYTAVPKASGSFEFCAPLNPAGPTADLILSASQGSGSVHVAVKDITPVVEDLPIYAESNDSSVYVYTAGHEVTESAPYIAEVPVKPDYVYLVTFSCKANEWNGSPVTENLMVGQVAMVQDGYPQPVAEFAEYTAVPSDHGSFEFIAHSNPTGPTADLILLVSMGGGKIYVAVEELGLAPGEPLNIYAEANDDAIRKLPAQKRSFQTATDRCEPRSR